MPARDVFAQPGGPARVTDDSPEVWTAPGAIDERPSHARPPIGGDREGIPPVDGLARFAKMIKAPAPKTPAESMPQIDRKRR